MNVARILFPVQVLGPGNRIGIWLCGCNRACKGCSNPELWIQRDEFEIDGVNFKILSEQNPEFAQRNPYNNSSMVVKMWDSEKSFIFLGDLGVEGGQKLLDSQYAGDLECDYLQMAHHGQAGCDKKFYETVKFRACLWPSPTWVYNAEMGQLRTAEVRGWIKELGITEHYVSNEGLVRIE